MGTEVPSVWTDSESQAETPSPAPFPGRLRKLLGLLREERQAEPAAQPCTHSRWSRGGSAHVHCGKTELLLEEEEGQSLEQEARRLRALPSEATSAKFSSITPRSRCL